MRNEAPKASAGAERAFRLLWLGQTVSQFGSQMTMVAVPLIAALVLHASPLDMGLLLALETAPFLVLALPAGALIDRLDRRRILIAADVGRAAAMGLLPAAAAVGALSMPLLYATTLMIGGLTVFFDIAYQSYLPLIVPREKLVDGNRRLEISASAAQVAGPGAAGALVAIAGASGALLLDAATYVVSALALSRAPGKVGTNSDEGSDEGSAKRGGGALDGLRVVFADPPLRDMAISSAAFNLASSMIAAVFVLYAVRDAHMDALGVGILYALANVGFVLGAIASEPLSRRGGIGRTIFAAAVLGALATVLLPFAVGPFAALVLFLGRFTGAVATPIHNVNAVALQQGRTQLDLQGRVNATFRLVDWGTVPVGALLGGALGTQLGLREVLAIAAVMGIGSAAWLVRSPLRHLTTLAVVHHADAADVAMRPVQPAPPEPAV
jgi:MFS family permease